MKKMLFATFTATLFLLFLLIFFTLYGKMVRQTEVNNALALSMQYAMEQLLLGEGKPVSTEDWKNDFVQSVAVQIESESELTVQI